jgi:hypothetical protein
MYLSRVEAANASSWTLDAPDADDDGTVSEVWDRVKTAKPRKPREFAEFTSKDEQENADNNHKGWDALRNLRSVALRMDFFYFF